MGGAAVRGADSALSSGEIPGRRYTGPDDAQPTAIYPGDASDPEQATMQQVGSCCSPDPYGRLLNPSIVEWRERVAIAHMWHMHTGAARDQRRDGASGVAVHDLPRQGCKPESPRHACPHVLIARQRSVAQHAAVARSRGKSRGGGGRALHAPAVLAGPGGMQGVWAAHADLKWGAASRNRDCPRV